MSDVPDLAARVAVAQLLPVRRPARRVVVRVITAERDRAGLSHAALRPEREAVALAAGVREVRNGLAVGRPGRVALGGAGGVGDVAGIPLLGGHGHDLAPGLEHRARPRGRDGRVLQLVADAHEVRQRGGQLAAQGDRDRGVFPRRQVVHVEGAELFVDDPARAGRGALDVEPVVLDPPRDLPGARVVGVEARRAVPIGDEEDRVRDPHRRLIGGVAARHLLDRRARQVRDPDRRGPPAPIALPGLVRRRVGQIGETPAVWTERSLPRAGEVEHRRGHLAHSLHEQPRRPVLDVLRDAQAGRLEQHLPVRGPAPHHVVVRMPGEPLGDPTRGRDHIDVRVAVGGVGVGDPLAVRREGAAIVAARNAARETVGHATRARREPDVAGEREADLARAQGRVLEQIGHLCPNGPRGHEQGERDDGERAKARFPRSRGPSGDGRT